MPMNVNAELELSLTYLIRAKEYAILFGYSQREIDRLDAFKKALCKLRSEIAERKRI